MNIIKTIIIMLFFVFSAACGTDLTYNDTTSETQTGEPIDQGDAGDDEDTSGSDEAGSQGDVPSETTDESQTEGDAGLSTDSGCTDGLAKGLRYTDTDSDGFGVGSGETVCPETTGYADNNTDCDDTLNSIYPLATEICDSVDNDCDGSTDEDLTLSTYYRDADGDGYGTSTTTISACTTVPTGYSSDSTDCNDASSAINPSATEICDSVDNDCDGSTDEGVKTTYYRDADSDTYGTSSTTSSACSAPTGYVTNSTDCDDTSSSSHPGASELCDDADNDCDGSTDEGLDPATVGFTSVFARTSTDIGNVGDTGGLPAGYEPSGLVWDDVLEKLFVVSDEGILSQMDKDGSSVVNFSLSGDLEGVTVADPGSEIVYVGVENPDSIIEYDVSGSGATLRTFTLTTWMTGPANAGLEALTFVPDASSPEGGYFYAGLQDTGDVSVFELPIVSSSTSITPRFISSFSPMANYLGTGLLDITDISDMYYDSDNEILYAIFDGYNKLVAMEKDGTYIEEWTLPKSDQEGFSLGGTCHVYIGEDTGTVWQY